MEDKKSPIEYVKSDDDWQYQRGATLSEAKWFLLFVLRRFEDGSAVLAGAVAPPSLALLMDCGGGGEMDGRISGGEDIPKVQRLIEAGEKFDVILQSLGGWNSVICTVRSFIKQRPDLWKYIRIDALFKPGGVIRDGCGGMGEMITRRLGGISPRTLRRTRDHAIHALAGELVAYSNTDGYNLNYYARRKK